MPYSPISMRATGQCFKYFKDAIQCLTHRFNHSYVIPAKAGIHLKQGNFMQLPQAHQSIVQTAVCK